MTTATATALTHLGQIDCAIPLPPDLKSEIWQALQTQGQGSTEIREIFKRGPYRLLEINCFADPVLITNADTIFDPTPQDIVFARNYDKDE